MFMLLHALHVSFTRHTAFNMHDAFIEVCTGGCMLCILVIGTLHWQVYWYVLWWLLLLALAAACLVSAGRHAAPVHRHILARVLVAACLVSADRQTAQTNPRREG